MIRKIPKIIADNTLAVTTVVAVAVAFFIAPITGLGDITVLLMKVAALLMTGLTMIVWSFPKAGLMMAYLLAAATVSSLLQSPLSPF